MSGKKVKCVALFSGGLDSSLAVLLMLKQNIEVTALMFLTHFGCDISDKSSCSHDPEPIGNSQESEIWSWQEYESVCGLPNSDVT